MNLIKIVALGLLLFLTPRVAESWLVQIPSVVVPGGALTLTADNAKNILGQPADIISTLNFPFPISKGTTSEPERVVVWNTSGGNLNFTSISYTGPQATDFSTSTTNCGVLPPGSYCYIWANFLPTTTGAESATMTIIYGSASASISLSGTGQSKTVVNIASCGLPNPLASNTTYVMGDVMCSNLALGLSQGSTNIDIVGDCRAPEGANTIFDGTNTTGTFADSGATYPNSPTNVRLFCITIERYGANGGCGNQSAPNTAVHAWTGWVVANSRMTNNCSQGYFAQSTAMLYHSRVDNNGYEGGDQQIGVAGGASGTIQIVGSEYDHNSTYSGGGANNCSAVATCGSFKFVINGSGPFQQIIVNGLYSHDNTNNSSDGAWCDQDSCGYTTITNSTILNNGCNTCGTPQAGGSDQIRYELSGTNGGSWEVSHNVVINPSGVGVQGAITAACSLQLKIDSNYIFNKDAATAAVWHGNDNTGRANCTGPFTFEASNNLVGWTGGGFQFGLTGGGTVTSITATGNAYYTGGGATNGAYFGILSGNENFATWKSQGHDTTGSIQTGTPPVMAGCTGDGTYGIGCVGSGMGATVPPAKMAAVTRAYDAMRTGWNQSETILTPSNAANIALQHTLAVDEQVDATPLLLPNLSIAGGTHDVLYVATANDTLYAFDANSGALLTSRNFGTPVPQGALPGACVNNSAVVGITGTPIIDRNSGILYLITYTYPGNVPTYTLHAVGVTTLADVITPIVVSGSAALSGGGTYNFNAAVSRQRPALLESSGNIYAAFGSFCDQSTSSSRGWIFGWTASALAPLSANYLTNKLSSTPSGGFLTAIWMSGAGPAADSSGNVYALTANPAGGSDYNNPNNLSDSAVKLSPDLSTLINHYTEQAGTDSGDTDFGAGGIMLLPVQSNTSASLTVAAGKDGNLELLAYNGLGNGPYATYSIGGCWCGESYYTGADGIGRVITQGGTTVEVWKVGGAPSLTQESSYGIAATGQDPGGFTSVSSNANSNVLIWSVSRPDGSTNCGGHQCVYLVAIDPVAKVKLTTKTNAGAWASTQNDSDIFPVVANGSIYVGSYKEVTIWRVPGT